MRNRYAPRRHRGVALYIRAVDRGSTAYGNRIRAWGDEQGRPVEGLGNYGGAKVQGAGYYLRLWDAGKNKYVFQSAGEDFEEALAQRDLASANARRGLHVNSAAETPAVRTALTDAIDQFIERKQMRTKRGAPANALTLTKYKTSLRGFDSFAERHNCRCLQDISERLLIDYWQHLGTIGNGTSSQREKLLHIRQLMTSAKLVFPLSEEYVPRRPKSRPDAYEDDLALRKLFAALDQREGAFLNLLLGAGVREQEAAKAQVRDFRVEGTGGINTFSVRHAKGSSVVDPKDRTVPLSAALAEQLKRYFAGKQPDDLAFPNGARKPKPEQHFLRTLKKRALKMGLNCGECVNKRGLSCAEHPVCRRWTLHKFRRTAASGMLRSGVALNDVMAVLGHTQPTTTLKHYAAVAAAEQHHMQAIANARPVFCVPQCVPDAVQTESAENPSAQAVDRKSSSASIAMTA